MNAPGTERLLRMGLDFNTIELNANRASGMTSTQQGKLYQHQKQLRVMMLAVWLAFFLLPVVAYIFIQVNMMRAWAMLLGLVVAEVLLACTGLRLDEQLAAVAKDLRLGMVVTAAGPVFLVVRYRGLFGRHRLRIEDQAFAVTAQVLQSFRHGDRYYVHYAPHSLVILSAESVAHAFKGTR